MPDGETKERTLKSLAEEAIQKSGIDPTAIYFTQKYAAEGAPVWEIEGACPSNDALVVLAIFDEERFVRIYCVPIKEKDKNGKPVGPCRYKLFRGAKDVAVDSFGSWDLFTSELAAEFWTVYASLGGADVELDRVKKHLGERLEGAKADEAAGKPMSAAVLLADILEALDAEEHRADDDDEDEDDEPEALPLNGSPPAS